MRLAPSAFFAKRVDFLLTAISVMLVCLSLEATTMSYQIKDRDGKTVVDANGKALSFADCITANAAKLAGQYVVAVWLA